MQNFHIVCSQNRANCSTFRIPRDFKLDNRAVPLLQVASKQFDPKGKDTNKHNFPGMGRRLILCSLQKRVCGDG